MVRFKYKGDHPSLQNETALGRYNADGKFVVQCDGHMLPGSNVPMLTVDHEDWAHGWHETPREDWEFVKAPVYRGCRDDCAEFVRANRSNLECSCFLDDTYWVVFGHGLDS